MQKIKSRIIRVKDGQDLSSDMELFILEVGDGNVREPWHFTAFDKEGFTISNSVEEVKGLYADGKITEVSPEQGNG